MDEYRVHKRAGAQIFRQAIKHIQMHGWDHNSMDILLAVTPGQRWGQPMAVLMFSELSNALGHQTLTQFDTKVKSIDEVIRLFKKVADSLESE